MTAAAVADAGPRPPGGRPDAVGQADELRGEVAARLAALIRPQPADPDAADRPAGSDRDPELPDVYVGWTPALAVGCCPARYRADGEGGWGFPGWSPPLAAASVGRAALARHLEDLDRSPGGVAAASLPAPLEVVRSWLRDAARAPSAPVAHWVAELARSRDRTTMAATAAAATRWVAGFVRTHGWPLPDRLGIVCDDAEGPHARRWAKRWRPSRGSSLCIASSPDAVAGKVTATGQFDLVVHRPSSPTDDALADRAAFEATAGALSAGIVASSVMVSTGDSGDRAHVPITPALLDRGAQLVVEVVRHRLVAAQPVVDDAAFGDATPGPGCRHCPHVHGAGRGPCAPGQAWLGTPMGRRRGGLPVGD